MLKSKDTLKSYKILTTPSPLNQYPIYLADPMRIVLLAGLLLTRNLKNGILLAVTIPLFSSLVIGHPGDPGELESLHDQRGKHPRNNLTNNLFLLLLYLMLRKQEYAQD
jgi:hypothetical protein